jgi:hypothetical protein
LVTPVVTGLLREWPDASELLRLLSLMTNGERGIWWPLPKDWQTVPNGLDNHADFTFVLHVVHWSLWRTCFVRSKFDINVGAGLPPKEVQEQNLLIRRPHEDGQTDN